MCYLTDIRTPGIQCRRVGRIIVNLAWLGWYVRLLASWLVADSHERSGSARTIIASSQNHLCAHSNSKINACTGIIFEFLG